jgi:hypothetical protein
LLPVVVVVVLWRRGRVRRVVLLQLLPAVAGGGARVGVYAVLKREAVVVGGQRMDVRCC